jgi:uncharacterized protein YfkK (UPF0435 family)
MLGIQNEEELSYAILDIRERLKNLEMNQTIINNNIIIIQYISFLTIIIVYISRREI